MAAAQVPARVIADDLRFRRKLRIGADAYATLKAKRSLGELAGVSGAAWAGSAIASSSAVASTFFAPTGFAAFFGLATAATPIGWVVAAAAAAGGAYYGLTRLMGNGGAVEEIPLFITSSVDELGHMLFGLIGTLAVHVAQADGEFAQTERDVILENFIDEWGFDRIYAEEHLTILATASGREQDISIIAAALHRLVTENPDCNASAMEKEMLELLDEVMRADGVLDGRERSAISDVRSALGKSLFDFGKLIPSPPRLGRTSA